MPSIATPCSRTTTASRTPSRLPHLSDRTPSCRDRSPPPDLRRPPAGRGHRAARVHVAVVAGDVRAGAVEADWDLPGGRAGDQRRGAGARRLPDLLALRHGLARDERGRGPAAAAPPRGDGDDRVVALARGAGRA